MLYSVKYIIICTLKNVKNPKNRKNQKSKSPKNPKKKKWPLWTSKSVCTNNIVLFTCVVYINLLEELGTKRCHIVFIVKTWAMDGFFQWYFVFPWNCNFLFCVFHVVVNSPFKYLSTNLNVINAERTALTSISSMIDDGCKSCSLCKS